jgi:hypothetical protein
MPGTCDTGIQPGIPSRPIAIAGPTCPVPMSRCSSPIGTGPS